MYLSPHPNDRGDRIQVVEMVREVLLSASLPSGPI